MKTMDLREFNLLTVNEIKSIKEKITITNNKIELFVFSPIKLKDNNIEMSALLKKVGMSIFAEYYTVLKRDDAMAYLPIKYSSNSRRLRVNSAKKIFDKDLHIDALNYILNSSRSDIRTKELAKKRLKKEGVIVDQRDIRLTTMVKELLPSLIVDGIFDDHMDRFLSKDYSKDKFGLQYALLQEVEVYYDIDVKRKDGKSHSRYYKDTLRYKGKEYLLCSHWEEKRHLKKFEEFIVDILSSNKVISDKYLALCNSNIKERLSIK